MKKPTILYLCGLVVVGGLAMSLAPRAGIAGPGQFTCHDVQDFGASRYNDRSIQRFFGRSMRRLPLAVLERALHETKHCIYDRKVETGMGSIGSFGEVPPQGRGGSGGGGDIGSAIVGGIFGALLDEALRGQNQDRPPNNQTRRRGQSGPNDFYLDRMVEAARRIDNLMYNYN